MCGLIYIFHILDKRRKAKGRPIKHTIMPRAPLYYFALPAFLDIFVVGLMNVALTMMAASSLQMLKGGTILITALMSITFLKRRLDGQHWGSMCLIFIGLYLVGRVESAEEQISNT